MKTVILPNEELFAIVQQQLDSGAKATIVVSGNSMYPMLCHRRDCVTLEKITDFAKAGDVLFYLRDNGQYVLHRVVGVTAPGQYVCSGDNQCDHEKVSHDQVIARVVSFTNKGREISCADFGYRVYTWCFVNFMFLRTPYLWARRKLGTVAKGLRRK